MLTIVLYFRLSRGLQAYRTGLAATGHKNSNHAGSVSGSPQGSPSLWDDLK